MKYHPYRWTRRDFMKIMGLTTAGVIIKSSGLARPLKTFTGEGGNRYLTQVAATQYDDYDQATITQKIGYLFDELGGIGDVVGPGDRVAVKINMTGGASWANDPNLQGVDILQYCRQLGNC